MNIVIIGSSIAGHTVAETLRAVRNDCSITLMGKSPYPAYDKRRLLEYLTRGMKEKDLFLVQPDHYEKNGITFLKECCAVSVGTVRKQVTYKDKDDKRSSIEYDILVVCSGRRTEFPDISGINKEGVYKLDSLMDYKDLRSHLITDPVCVMGCGDSAVSVARALAARRKEVKLISAGPVPEGTREFQGPSETVETLFTEVVELIGESGIQAVRLKEGKIIGTSLPVFMPEPKKANIDFFKNSEIKTENGLICVDESMRTNVEGVYASGSVCARAGAGDINKSWDDVIKESRLAADSIALAMGG